jgi:uncharacterized protein YebE (UPF0316 family)
MNASIALTFALIVVARIADVTLDTLRTASIVQGRRTFSAILGFVQALIYIVAIAKVLLNMGHPIYALAYAIGFALGTFLGITIERRLAFGQQVVSLFTRKGSELAEALTAAGYRVARVQGHARVDEVTILYVEVLRKQARALIRDVNAVDSACFYVLNDVRQVGLVRGSDVSPDVRRSNDRRRASAKGT